MQNDIGLVNTATTIQYYRGVGPACLPYSQQNANFAGVSVIANGWGSSEFAGPISTKLKKASLTVSTKQVCQSQYSDLVNSQMCAYSSAAGTSQVRTNSILRLLQNYPRSFFTIDG